MRRNLKTVFKRSCSMEIVYNASLLTLLLAISIARAAAQDTTVTCEPIPADYCNDKDENKNYPNPADCNKAGCRTSYIICVTQVPQILPCPTSTSFSDATGECGTPSATCENITPAVQESSSSEPRNRPESTAGTSQSVPSDTSARNKTTEPGPTDNQSTADSNTEQRIDTVKPDDTESMPIEDLLNESEPSPPASTVDHAENGGRDAASESQSAALTPSTSQDSDRTQRTKSSSSESMSIDDLLNQFGKERSDTYDAPAQTPGSTGTSDTRTPQARTDTDTDTGRTQDDTSYRYDSANIDERDDIAVDAQAPAHSLEDTEAIEPSAEHDNCRSKDLAFDLIGDIEEPIDLELIAAVLSNLTDAQIEGKSVSYLVRMGAAIGNFPLEYTDQLVAPVENIFKKTIALTNTRWVRESDIRILTVTDDVSTVSRNFPRRSNCPGHIVMYIEAELFSSDVEDFRAASDLLDAVSVIERRSINKVIPTIIDPREAGFRVPTKLRAYMRDDYASEFSSTSLMIARVTVSLPNDCVGSAGSISRDIQLAIQLGDLRKALIEEAGIQGVAPQFSRFSIVDLKGVEVDGLENAPAAAPCPGPDGYDYDEIARKKKSRDEEAAQDDYELGTAYPSPKYIDIPLPPVPSPKHFPNLTVDESKFGLGNSAQPRMLDPLALFVFLISCVLMLL